LDLDTGAGAGKRSVVMMIFECAERLEWGALDLPLVGIPRDWHGAAVEPVPGYALACDPDHLWFVAHHRAPASCHPQSRPGLFCADLWKHDVAELFLADPVSGRYLEFNLAPNSAWWSCEFAAPRQRAEAADVAVPGVRTWADLAPDGAWMAAMSIPLDVLRAKIAFSNGSRGNICMILGSPDQRFLTAASLGRGGPDFHRPESFPELAFQPLSAIGWSGRVPDV